MFKCVERLLAVTLIAISWSAQAQTDCGTSGTLTDRVANCATSVTTRQKVIWQLVTQLTDTSGTHQVWQDTDPTSGLLWGDVLSNIYSFDTAIKVDERSSSCIFENTAPNWSYNCPVIEETACGAVVESNANGAITEKIFGLPTIQDFILANAHGIREVLPHMQGYSWFRTASLYSKDRHYVIEFSGSGTPFNQDLYDRTIRGWVRCVGR